LPVSTTVQVPLPNEDKNIQIGNKNLYNLGVTAYQPISQQIKIKTGLEVNRMDVAITEKEKQKIALQISQGVEQLYYGTLIAQKQLEEAEAKLAVAKAKLGDVETAIAAGKTIDVNQAGLLANIADEEQNMLKLSIQAQNYKSDLIKLTVLLMKISISKNHLCHGTSSWY
jgi:outer membrane protein TolC